MSKTNATFDGKYPEVSAALGMPFSALKADTQTHLLAEWAKSDQWQKVVDGQEFIKPFQPVEAFNGTTFHVWLLTNPESKAFDLWQSIKAREKTNQTYRWERWGDSAALLMYSNQPHRLSSLDLKEWTKPINVTQLRECGIFYTPKVDVSEKVQDKVKGWWFGKEPDRAKDVSPMECACFHGSKEMIDACVETYGQLVAASTAQRALPTSWSKTNLLTAFKGYMLYGDVLPLIPLLKAVKATDAWYAKESSTATYYNSREGQNNLLRTAFTRLGLERIRMFWNKASDDSKKDLFGTHWKWLEFKRALLKSERLDALGLAETLEKEYFKITKDGAEILNHSFTLGDLWTNVKEGKTKAVNFLLNQNPAWLEEKDWVYENRSGSYDKKRVDAGSKKGTALVLAAVHGHQELVDELLERGASPAPLKDVMEYEPFKKSEFYERFAPIAERIRLRQKVSKKSGDVLKASSPTSAL